MNGNKILGIVSNCWAKQLEDGIELGELICEAVSRGFRAIELRQTCLGRFESTNENGRYLPDANSLAALPAQFPQVRFNVAVNVPFLSQEMGAFAPIFSAGKNAACAVSGQFTPHLRLVDLTTSAEEIQTSSPADAAHLVTRLALAMAEHDGILSIENALQPWRWFREVFSKAREELAIEAPRLRLCYDPCNLLMSDDKLDLAELTAALAHDQLSMVHFKQRRDGNIGHQIQDGELDWRKQLYALKQLRYDGPYLFEVAANDDIWEHLELSLKYLRRLGLETNTYLE